MYEHVHTFSPLLSTSALCRIIRILLAHRDCDLSYGQKPDLRKRRVVRSLDKSRICLWHFNALGALSVSFVKVETAGSDAALDLV